MKKLLSLFVSLLLCLFVGCSGEKSLDSANKKGTDVQAVNLMGGVSVTDEQLYKMINIPIILDDIENALKYRDIQNISANSNNIIFFMDTETDTEFSKNHKYCLNIYHHNTGYYIFICNYNMDDEPDIVLGYLYLPDSIIPSDDLKNCKTVSDLRKKDSHFCYQNVLLGYLNCCQSLAQFGLIDYDESPQLTLHITTDGIFVVGFENLGLENENMFLQCSDNKIDFIRLQNNNLLNKIYDVIFHDYMI